MTSMPSLDGDELVRRISRDLVDSYDEELEMEIEDRQPLGDWSSDADPDAEKGYRQRYFGERTQWYFQRYVPHLPAAGEIVLFDRSWYNRAGVERVMGFCTPEEYEEFYRSVPEFERMLVRSGVRLLKYWFSITDEEQYIRFLGRIHDPLKQWKLSPMDLESRRRWEEYTKAKEAMLERTHIPEARWWVVHAVDKKRARLNCIDHLLKQFPYREVSKPTIVLPERVHHEHYSRQAVPADMVVPEIY
jgi:polyphosphate kinase